MEEVTKFWIESGQPFLADIALNFTYYFAAVLTICTLGVVVVYLTFKTPVLITGVKNIYRFIVNRIKRRKLKRYRKKREGYLKGFLSPRTRRKLQDQYDSFRLYMRPVDLIPKLLTRGLLEMDSRTYKLIKQKQLAEDKNELIMNDVVMNMSYEQLESFKECLIESGQKALANFVPELDQEEVECLEQNKLADIKAHSQKQQNKRVQLESPCLAQGDQQQIQQDTLNPDEPPTVQGDYINTKVNEMASDIEHVKTSINDYNQKQEDFKHRFKAMVKEVDDKRQKLSNKVKDMERRNFTGEMQLSEMKTDFEEIKQELETNMSSHSKELQDQIDALGRDSGVASRMVEERRKTEMQRLKRESELFEQRVKGIIGRLEKSYEDKITSIQETTELNTRELMEDNEKLYAHLYEMMTEFQEQNAVPSDLTDRLTDMEQNYRMIMENIDYVKNDLTHTFAVELKSLKQQMVSKNEHLRGLLQTHQEVHRLENTDLKEKVNSLEDQVNTMDIVIQAKEGADKSWQTMVFKIKDFLMEKNITFEEYLSMHPGTPMHRGIPLRRDMEMES